MRELKPVLLLPEAQRDAKKASGASLSLEAEAQVLACLLSRFEEFHVQREAF